MLEDLIFGICALELKGEDEFFEFADRRAFVIENGVFNKLLSES